MEIFISLLVFAIIIIVFIISSGNKTSKAQEQKQTYEQLLKGGNKRAALDAGRAYYSALRDKKALTVYDEQAIANDLSTMNVNHISQTVLDNPRFT